MNFSTENKRDRPRNSTEILHAAVAAASKKPKSRVKKRHEKGPVPTASDHHVDVGQKASARLADPAARKDERRDAEIFFSTPELR